MDHAANAMPVELTTAIELTTTVDQYKNVTVELAGRQVWRGIYPPRPDPAERDSGARAWAEQMHNAALDALAQLLTNLMHPGVPPGTKRPR